MTQIVTKSDLIVPNWRKDNKAISKFQFVHHFIPHPELKTRATLLSNKALLIYCALMVLVTLAFRVVPLFLPGVLGYASNISVQDLLNFSNSRREDAGLSPLVLNEKLTQAAEKKAQHMFDHDYWSHVSPDGVEPWSFIVGEKYDYVYAGENLAKNFSNSKDVVDAWYDSPTHRENLMSPNYMEMGFAVRNGILNGYETTLVVQMFGRPRDLAYLSTQEDQERILQKYGPISTQEVVVKPDYVKPLVDVPGAARLITFSFALSVTILLILDIWFTRKFSNFRYGSHSAFHLGIFILVLIGMWFVLKPGFIM